MVISLAAIHLARVRLRQVRRDGETREARLLAQSAVEQAVSVMNNYAGNWREDFDGDQETSPMAFGAGQMSFMLVDADGDLADDPTDPLWIHGIGRVGDAVWVERAKARVDQGLPLEFLRTAIHSRGKIEIPSGKALSVVGAPASTDSDLRNDSILEGDVEALGLSGSGPVTGKVTVPSEKKGIPPRSLIDDYIARATVLPYEGHLDKVVLAPGVNEYGGGLNQDGVYYLDTDSHDLELKDTRVHGTLILRLGPKRVTAKTCVVEAYREDFPALIVIGELRGEIKETWLDESSAGHNFNPSGAPFEGATDTDKLDSYRTGIYGLVHVIGDAELLQTGESKGVFVVDGPVKISNSVKLVHDPELMFNPPLGYTDDPNSTAMIIRSGSWSRQPAP
jgi:hypothetical protein